MMESWDAWDIAIYLAAAYIAVVTVVRLMVNERARLVEQFRSDLLAERERQASAELQRKKDEAAKARPTRGAA